MQVIALLVAGALVVEALKSDDGWAFLISLLIFAAVGVGVWLVST